MSQQRQHPQHQSQPPVADGGSPEAGGPGLAQERSELARAYAAADAILDQIRQDNPERFLHDVRQSGGQ